jgi:hypothetical protein
MRGTLFGVLLWLGCAHAPARVVIVPVPAEAQKQEVVWENPFPDRSGELEAQGVGGSGDEDPNTQHLP